MDRIHEVNILKTNLTLKTNRVINSVRRTFRSSVTLISNLAKTTNKKFSIRKLAKGAEREWEADATKLAGRRDLLSIASFAEVAMGEANLTEKKRLLGPGWRTVRKSLQKIVMLGQDPDLIFDNSGVVLEKPPRASVYVSIYWLVKFLSFSEPGPLCNHDIVCSHRNLKVICN